MAAMEEEPEYELVRLNNREAEVGNEGQEYALPNAVYRETPVIPAAAEPIRIPPGE